MKLSNHLVNHQFLSKSRFLFLDDGRWYGAVIESVNFGKNNLHTSFGSSWSWIGCMWWFEVSGGGGANCGGGGGSGVGGGGGGSGGRGGGGRGLIKF
jgi:hypothetical protein